MSVEHRTESYTKSDSGFNPITTAYFCCSNMTIRTTNQEPPEINHENFRGGGGTGGRQVYIFISGLYNNSVAQTI